MHHSIDAPERAPAPVSLAQPVEEGTMEGFWSVWRADAMRGAPIESPAEAEAFRRLATARAQN